MRDIFFQFNFMIGMNTQRLVSRFQDSDLLAVNRKINGCGETQL